MINVVKDYSTMLIDVDYEKSVKEAVQAGRYDLTEEDVEDRNFSAGHHGRSVTSMDIISFTEDILYIDAIRQIDEMGYRPAELHELLALGEQRPGFQVLHPIIALGSMREGPDKCHYVPYLDARKLKRHLGLDWIGGKWSNACYFAVVPKLSS